MNCKKGKKQTKESIETNPELTQMSEWADKNIKIEIITVFCIFKTLIREKILLKKKDCNQISRGENYSVWS